MRRDLVVIGASAGGIDALRAIARALPADFPASIAVVLHMAADAPGILNQILDRAGPLSAICVRSAELMRPGTIYVPRPDHHLVVEPSGIRSTRGPRENRFRPAIDPLFRSAAQTFGPRAVGIILTGGLDDGTAGLWAIKQLGGTTIVQDPDEALVDSMPRNALAHVRVDHVVPLAGIAPLLVRLVDEDMAVQGGYAVPEPMEIEVNIAKESDSLEAGVGKLGVPSPFACPECHGVLLQLKEGDRVRFRCHTGHAYSAETLIAEFDEAIENALWNSLRAMQEKVILMERLATHAREAHEGPLADALQARAEAAHRRTEAIRQATMAEPEPQALVESADRLKRTAAE